MDIEQLRADHPGVYQAVTDQGFAAGKAESGDAIRAERERIKGIMSHSEAEGRGALAMSLALDTELPVEAAAKVLSAAAKEQQPVDLKNQFAAHMAGINNSAVGADDQAHDEEREQQSITASWANAYKRIGAGVN